jgi:hypothetical protein
MGILGFIVDLAVSCMFELNDVIGKDSTQDV